MPDIQVEPFESPRDIDGTCRTFSSALRHSYWPMIDEADPELVRDVVTGFVRFGNRTLVALDHGDVVGILVGYTAVAPRRVAATGALLVSRLLPGVLLGRYHTTPRARRFLLDVARGLGPFELLDRPRAGRPCEVLLFAVHQLAQGRGVGRRLMDAFVDRARADGARRALVTTDSTLAWCFYPAYGFERIRTAPLGRCYRVSLPGVEAQAFRYSLDLVRRNAGDSSRVEPGKVPVGPPATR